MENKLLKRENNGLLDAMNRYIERTGLDEVITSINTKTNTASITGSKDGYQYTTTVKAEKCGTIQTSSVFERDVRKKIGKNALASQIKDLLNEGYTQREVATMLGVSQPLVSKYSRL